MKRIARKIAIVLALTVIASEPLVARAGDMMELVIGNGPHAGTYKFPGKGLVICMQQKGSDQLSAVFKDMDAKDIKQLSGVGFNVFKASAAGPKTGGIRVTFGDPFNAKQQATYEVMIPGDSKGPISMTRAGESISLAFAGATKAGISLKLKMSCDEVGSY
jgi:hypothetical protein